MEWISRLAAWNTTYKAFLAEQTRLPNGNIVPTHHRLITAKNTLNTLVKQETLFTYLDAKLDRETITLASLFVRESATNALKYAPSASNVDLIIELAPEILSLTMRNDVAALPQARITGGFGLSNLRQRIEASGGSLTFVHNDNEWVIISSIPYSR